MSDAALFPTLLVMLALDEHDPSVVQAVIGGARSMGTRSIILAHVSPADPLAGTLGMRLNYDDAGMPDALRAAAEEIQEALPGCTVELEHGRGAPEAVLEEIIQRRDVDLLVIGRLRRSRSATGWGPSGRKLLRAVSCSALVVPEGSRLDLTHAVVGLDFSAHAAHALGLACRLTDTATAVCQYDPRVASQGGLSQADFGVELTRNARSHFDTVVRPQLPEGEAPRFEVLAGVQASDVLLDRAGDAVLVVGSRGLNKLATVLLGSTAERLAGRARGPVLIIRKKGEVLGLLDGLFRR